MTNSEDERPVCGVTDADDRLVAADARLAMLQATCGGKIGSIVAVPMLLELVEKARSEAKTVSEEFQAYDGLQTIKARAEIVPKYSGTKISIIEWSAEPIGRGSNILSREIDRNLAECAMRVDLEHRIVSIETESDDLAQFHKRGTAAMGQDWRTILDFSIEISGNLDWRQLDGKVARIAGSRRSWTVHIERLDEGEEQAGFVVYLTANEALSSDLATAPGNHAYSPSLGRDLTPALRQPVDRIISHAETIRSKLAGPLSDNYSEYAKDIADAGQHLLGLIDDLSDLEAVEAENFTTAPDRIDLAEVAQRACGILGARAKEKQITLVPPVEGESQMAIAEFRRVLQILLNLVGNAIRYSPQNSQVWVRTDAGEGYASVTVADQGHGLDEEQQKKVFEKFERLGRSGDSGSGLGLYISRRIACAMNGDLIVESAPGQGARFTLKVPDAALYT
ncbi:HAMP domain-containing histidine kinase [Erythrobacter litoralis]|uniref:sensor histidine kinase n=1 Tax=Erythrobacter litoralis TaxID=39960 RepID=UPI002435B42C|nr:HAMP domain-containing sensor histidine kinase [Erythrobacter litoralis]MDG6078233.1 HAMP domain-containing histidine kinase [Erythrobacter litoralis]